MINIRFKTAIILSLSLLLFVALPAQSATVLLDTTTLSFSASGSPNTIAGSWSTSPLVIADGATIEYFTVELTEINSDFGRPQSISFSSYIPSNSRSLSFCFNSSSCVADTIVGDTGIITSGSSILWVWDFMNRLVAGNNPQITNGNSTVAYSSGGGSASINGQVMIHVYGEAAVVPLPPAIYLFGFGALALIKLGKK